MGARDGLLPFQSGLFADVPRVPRIFDFDVEPGRADFVRAPVEQNGVDTRFNFDHRRLANAISGVNAPGRAVFLNTDAQFATLYTDYSDETRHGSNIVA